MKVEDTIRALRAAIKAEQLAGHRTKKARQALERAEETSTATYLARVRLEKQLLDQVRAELA
jgi:hypothetical protein